MQAVHGSLMRSTREFRKPEPLYVAVGSLAGCTFNIHGSSPVTKTFFDELTRYLEVIALYKCDITVAGDLNILIEDPDNTDGVRLLDLFQSFGCVQRVNGSTHLSGGTLDQVYTRTDNPPSNVSIDPPGIISDHGFVTWTQTLEFQNPIASSKTIRSWKKMDRDKFREALLNSDVCGNFAADATPDQLFDYL